MMVNVKKLLLLFLCAVGQIVQAARVLGMFPLFAKSHHRIYQPIMKTLALSGHQVVVYSPFPLDQPHPNYTDVYLENMSTEGAKISEIFRDVMGLPPWKCLQPLLVVADMVLHEFIHDKQIQQLLKSEEKFDVIFSDAYFSQEFLLILGDIFNAPSIVVQTSPLNNIANSNLGNDLSFSYIPDLCTSYSNRMSFIERTLNTFYSMMGLYRVYYNFYLPRLEKIMKEHFPNMPPLVALTRNVSLIFMNDHLTVDYTQPRTPHIIPIAGIHIEPGKFMPMDIKNFMDEAPDGVIFFSLGTYVSDELQPREYFEMYINVFRQLRQRVLWKSRKENIEGLPDNVMTVKWAPQQDVLAHPKCVLFITHGGLLSQQEAIHFAVPVVGIPQFYDQHRNVKFYQAKGVGVKVAKKDLSEKTMFAALQTVIGDPQYRENMKRLSQIFRDRPMSPAETVVFWTEYVLRHGGARHLRPASTQLRWYQLALLDILAAVLAAILTVLTTFYLVYRTILLNSFKRKK